MKPLIILLAALGLVTSPPVQENSSATLDAAIAFRESLTAQQLANAQRPFDEGRSAWQFVSAGADGVALAELDDTQTRLARALLKASVSETGFRKIEDIRELEAVLFDLEGGNPTRDRTNYRFTFFGTPSKSNPWAWRYQGHHVSLNFTFRDGKLMASSPQFLGASPAEVRSGPQKGKRPLAKEQDLAFELIKRLSESQRKLVVISDRAPPDILTGNSRVAAIQERSGIPWSKLDRAQQAALWRLIEAHAEVQQPKERARRLNKIEKDSLVFAWMGSTSPGQGHYYRIQGSTFLIEYDNTQNQANHIHTVWRDFKGDFGRDTLAEHYRHSPHHRH